MLIALSVVALTASYPCAARADERRTAYDEAVRIGLDEYSAGNYPEALAAMKHAHEINPNARTFRGMGVTAFEMREYVDALRYLTAALASNVNPLPPQLRAPTEHLINRTRLNVGSISLDLRPRSGMTLRIDGKPATMEPDGTVAVNIGERTLEFDAPGYAPTTRILTVESGKPLRATVVLQASSSSPNSDSPPTTGGLRAEPPSAPENAQTLRRVAWWGFGTAGAMTVGGAVALGIRELRVRQFQEAGCMTPLSPECSDQSGRVSTNRVVGIVVLSAAGVLAVGATVLLWKAPRSTSSVQAQARCSVGLGMSCRLAF
jgi:hypothetical protein